MARELSNGGNLKGPLQINGSAGTSGQVLVSAGAGAPPTWQDDANSHPGYSTGKYFYPFGCAGSSGSGANLTASRVYYLPFYCGIKTTFTRIGIDVATGASGKVARLGIYSDNPANNGQPGTLLLDAGTVSVGAAAVVEATISYTMTPGPYYLALITDGVIAMRSLTSNAQMLAGWFGLTASNATTVNGLYYEAGSGTTLPSTAATSQTAASIFFPIWLRV